jgi:transposase-like protein
VLNHTQYPSDVIALVVLWRLRYRLTLRDLAEMFLVRGLVFSHEAVREWEAKLAPALADQRRRRRHGRGGTRCRHWHVDETYLKVRGRWCYLYRVQEQWAGARSPGRERPNTMHAGIQKLRLCRALLSRLRRAP